MPDLQQSPPIPCTAKCVTCGYSLYQLEVDRCPECGKPFDRNRPESMGIRKSFLETFSKRFEPRTSRFIVALPIMAALLLVYSSMLPGFRRLETVLAVDFWIAYIIGHGPFLIARHSMWKRGWITPNRAQADHREIRRGIIAFLVSVFFFCVPIPLFVSFWIYHSDLNKLARSAPEYCADYPIDVWIGPMHFDSIGRHPNSIQLNVNAFDWVNYREVPQAAFILNTDPRNKDSDNQGWHLTEDWYMGF